jgi:hypothetical protein
VKERAMGTEPRDRFKPGNAKRGAAEIASVQGLISIEKRRCLDTSEEADAMHAVLVKRCDELVGCTEGSPEEEELRTLEDVIEAYEAKRWPSGKVASGKG